VRQGKANHALNGQDIEGAIQVEDTALRFLRQAAERLGWSGRGLHRTLKVARTIADLAGAEGMTTEHVAEALQYRPVLPA
jgi:magnesium chelatase family protein